MKKYIFTAACALFALSGLQSCMDFDIPGDELTGNNEKGEDVVYHGEVDKIDYRREITEEGFEKAQENLKSYLGMMVTAQYCMRGGKEGQKPGSHQYQAQYNITVDNYAGYFVVPHNFAHSAEGVLNSTYYFSRKFNDGPAGGFINVKNAIVPLLNHPDVDSIPEIKAIGLLIYNYSSQEMADLYGPFPYIDYKENKENHPYKYITMKEIYYNIVDNLDTISACFKHYAERPEWYQKKVNKILKSYDYVTDDFSIDTWNRFANSLKLRMAMHMVKVEPETAKKWAEEAVAAGVVETTSQEIALKPSFVGFSHPLIEIAKTWGDTRLNASFESLLSSLKHPYMDYFFTKNSCALVNSEDDSDILPINSKVIGLRAGIQMSAGQEEKTNPRTGYSQPISDQAMAWAPLYLIKLSEIQFLKAEGALRGWNMGGTAQEFYEAGIRNAQIEDRTISSQYMAKVDEYMQLEEAVPYTYVDPMDHKNDIESVTKIGVKWNEGDSQEVKLEKIITQKYIASFPYSVESWTDMRRTGYPKIFPVLSPEDSDGSLKAGDLIRRMLFPGDTQASMQDVKETGIPALGAPDQMGTRLWWDLDQPNF